MILIENEAKRQNKKTITYISLIYLKAQEKDKLAPPTKPLISELPSYLISKPPLKVTLDPFYEKYCHAMDVPVIASKDVSGTDLLIAKDIIIHMWSERPHLLLQLMREGQKAGIIGGN